MLTIVTTFRKSSILSDFGFVDDILQLSKIITQPNNCCSFINTLAYIDEYLRAFASFAEPFVLLPTRQKMINYSVTLSLSLLYIAIVLFASITQCHIGTHLAKTIQAAMTTGM